MEKDKILTIEEEAKEYVSLEDKRIQILIELAFIEGAKSNSSKAFHTKDMFSKEQLIELCTDAFITGTRINDITFPQWLVKQKLL